MAALTIVLLLISLLVWNSDASTVSTDELVKLIRDLKGTDERIMRWDASEHTAKLQADGSCSILPQVAELLVKEKDDNRWRLGCEYLTWCITDNPFLRAKFSEVDGVHKAVVKIVKKGSPQASAAASHLVYIATFANEKNHQSFFKEGAVKALAGVITTKDALAVQLMWAMAALQNLEASYCATRDNGRCYWEWQGEDHVTIDEHALPMISDGSPIRKAVMKDPVLVSTLQEYACKGPVEGPASDTNVLPGENARAGHDDDNMAIVPWAAIGALKNLALEKEAKPLLEGSTPFVCYCHVKKSDDWLEGT